MDTVIVAVTARAVTEGLAPTIWQNFRWAPFWYQDASEEAARDGRHARGREIIFAVAFAESYLFEFVLTQALAGAPDRFNEINEYFDPGRSRTVAQKWKDVPKELKRKGRISEIPNLGDGAWKEFVTLVEIRNGLVHGRASRPSTSEIAPDLLPLPTAGQLESMAPGWALGVVLARVFALHQASGIILPEWLASSHF